MNKYYFKTNEFGLTDNGIDFLRSGFNYKTINFPKIHKADITNNLSIVSLSAA